MRRTSNFIVAFIVLHLQSLWGAGLRSVLTDEITAYETIINNGIKESNQYQLSTDNEEYRPQKSQLVKDFSQWDFIIVGAGCSGAVVANRLSEVKHWKVLLIEAGGAETNFSVIPGMQSYLHSSRFNWGYYSTEQKHSCLGMREHRCPIIKGRSLGGGSAIDYGIYSRGNKDDYDKWAAEGNPGWSFKEILPYYIKSENFQILGDSGYHGKDGYWNVKHIRPVSEQFQNFLAGSQHVRNFTSTDYNGREELGFFQMQFNHYRQFRDSTNNAFLKPIRNRKNLKIITDAYVTKVMTRHGGTEVQGVYFSKNGKQYYARARIEVILSAGAINTPQILMLSGIGIREHLKEMKIPVVRDLPVGKILYDHNSFFGTFIDTNLTAPDPENLQHQIKDFLNDYGPLTNPSNCVGIGFYQTKYETNSSSPDLEIAVNEVVGSSVESYFIKDLRVRNETYFAIADSLRGHQTKLHTPLITLKPQSVGSVTLKSNDPYQHPNIDVNLLSKENDIEIIYQGILTIQEVLKAEPFRKINATLILVDYPQCRNYGLGSKDYWYCAIRLIATSAYHQCGTCRMGSNPKTSVVNNRGIVHGFKNLRIADASIFPSLVAGHTGAPAVMVGERISDFIKLQYGIPIQPITNTIH